MDVQLAPLFVSGKLEHIIVLATDISEQIATKHKLELSESRHRLLLNTLPYGVQEMMGGLDSDSRISRRLSGPS